MIDDILLMVKLVKSGSFVNAAKELGVAQSTISRRIDLLEKKLGVKLVKRDSRNIGLTDKGSLLYENFKNQEDRLKNLLAPITSENHSLGKLRILLPLSSTTTFFTPDLIKLAWLRSDFEIDIHFSSEDTDKVKNKYDVVIASSLSSSKRPDQPAFYSTKIIAVCSEKYIKKFGFLERREEIGNHLIVGVPVMGQQLLSKIYLYSESDNSLVEVNYCCRIKVNSFIEAKCILTQCEAITFLPEKDIQQELKDGKLIRVLPSYYLGKNELFLISNISVEDERFKLFKAAISDSETNLK